MIVHPAEANYLSQNTISLPKPATDLINDRSTLVSE